MPQPCEVMASANLKTIKYKVIAEYRKIYFDLILFIRFDWEHIFFIQFIELWKKLSPFGISLFYFQSLE